jgi:hypothetical protein
MARRNITLNIFQPDVLMPLTVERKEAGEDSDERQDESESTEQPPNTTASYRRDRHHSR